MKSPQSVPLTWLQHRVASGELPITTPEVRQRLTGSLMGADDAEVQQIAARVNPSRVLCRQQCSDCGYHWQAPARGTCPQCHSNKTAVESQLVCMAQRV